MYFWRIEKLKSEMVARPLSDREVLPYLLVFVGLYSAASFIPSTMANVWDGLGAVWSVLLAVAGTIYIYHQNGGKHGRHFLQRYFALGWVVTIRWVPIIIGAVVGFFATLTVLNVEAEDTTWYEFVFFAFMEAIIYLRIGHHVGDLANRTKPDQQAATSLI